MSKVFIDSDIFLDIFLAREPHNLNSSKVLDISSIKSGYLLFTTSICIANIYYFINKAFDKTTATDILKIILSRVQIIQTSGKAIQSALTSDFKDIEDAFQYYSAVEFGINTIVTRNKKDYKTSSIPIFTPTEFLAAIR